LLCQEKFLFVKLDLLQQVRHIHNTPLYYLNNIADTNTTNSKDSAVLKNLYKHRIAPIKVFMDPTLISCSNILNREEKREFFNKLSTLIYEKGGYDLGVIYVFQYKQDPKVYYIGRTTSLNARLINHLSKRKYDKFHLAARRLG
jgi:hypothetical protein